MSRVQACACRGQEPSLEKDVPCPLTLLRRRDCPLQAKEGLPGGHQERGRVPCREAHHCPLPRCPESALDAQGQGGLRVPTRGREDRAGSGQGREPGAGQTWAETSSATASAREGQGPAGGASSPAGG